MWMNLEPAWRLAREDFARRDPEAMAFNAGVSFQKGRLIIPFLGDVYLVSYPGGDVRCGNGRDKEGEIALAVQIILLHYLVHSTPAVLEGGFISFKELPGGNIYLGPFTGRVIRPLLKYFGRQPEKLVAAGEKMGGKPAGIGEFSVTLPVLPKIPVTFVVWSGDEEFPPTGNALFDPSAPKHLHTEDYVVLCGLALDRLRKAGGEQS